jgi:hypothetical protein
VRRLIYAVAGVDCVDIYNASAALTPDAFKAFSKPPRQQILRPGEELFRFGTILSAASPDV